MTTSRSEHLRKRALVSASVATIALSTLACFGFENNMARESPDVWNGASGWSVMASPCSGDVIALWFDSGLDGMAGCGTNTEGKGLFVTKDGGLSWTSAREFEQVRVNDIRRDNKGQLYAAGWSTIDGWSACAIDESGDRLVPTGLFVPGTNAFAKVAQGQNIVVRHDGRAMVDSLTGAQLAYRASADAAFEEVPGVGEAALDDPDDGVFQLKKIIQSGDGFWATGGIISQPAMIFLPSKREGATYHFQPIALQSDTRRGDLNDLHYWDNRSALAVGYDQSTQYPLIYRLDRGDPYTAADWEAIDVADFGIEYKGGINAMAVRGDEVVVVGERVPTSEGGFVWRSADRGKTWEDITPSFDGRRVGKLFRVWSFVRDGGLFVAGGGAAYRYTR